METTPRQFEIRDYVRIFSKRKWFILLVTLALTLIGGLYAVSYRAKYRASALVLIRRQPIERIRFLQGEEIEPASRPTQYTLDTQCQIATSHDAAKRTALKLQGRTSGQKIVTDASEVKASLSARPEEPDRIVVTATNEERPKAIAFANEAAETFVTISAELRNADVIAAREFLEEQSENVSRELEDLVARLADYQSSAGIVVPDIEAQATMEELRTYEHSLTQATSELGTLTAQRQELQKQLNRQRAKPIVQVPTREPNPERAIVESQLRQHQVELANLLARYRRDHPAVQQVQRQIQSLEARLERLPEYVERAVHSPNSRIQQLEDQIDQTDIQIAQQRERIDHLQATINRISANASDLPLELADIDRLKNRIDLLRNTYQNFMTQLEQSKLRDAIKSGSATVIDEAVTAQEIKPQPGRVLIFAFALGLFAAFMLSLLLEALDDTFHSPEDLKYYTDIPFLGMIPMLEDGGDELVTITAPKSPPAEAYRVLRSNIHFAQIENPARTYLVTSAGAGEGKSITAANLAVVFAQAGQGVLMIDSDLRRPVQHRLFGVNADRGLTNVLMGESTLEEVAVASEVPGLSVLPTGPLPPNPAELLDSDPMDEVLREAITRYDIVLLDSPPAIVLTDAVLLASRVDETILVAECDHVSRSAFDEMVRLIRNARGSVLGALLNKLKLSTSDYYYYYYYYDYYTSETPVTGITGEEPGESDTEMNEATEALREQEENSDPQEAPTEESRQENPESTEKEQTEAEPPTSEGEPAVDHNHNGNNSNNNVLDDLLGLNGDDE